MGYESYSGDFNLIIYEKAFVQGKSLPDYFCRLLKVVTKSAEVQKRKKIICSIKIIGQIQDKYNSTEVISQAPLGQISSFFYSCTYPLCSTLQTLKQTLYRGLLMCH